MSKETFELYPGARRCVGCGYCCIKVPCAQSLHTWGKRDCPALVWNGKRYICEKAGQWSELYIGEGCCASLNTWRLDVRNRDDLRGKHEYEYVNPEGASTTRSQGS
jgi:hypothetical protein